MRVLITGGGGQLAYDLVRTLRSHEVIALSHHELDVCNYPQVADAISTLAPDVVINTAAFHRVDACETQPELAFATNALAVRNLSEVCRQSDLPLVHFSTDYVFGGQAKREPLTEDDPPAPLSVYGVSKLAGEYLIRCTWQKASIIRTCGLYGVAGASGKGGNFVQTMLRKARQGEAIRVVNDQTCTPTYTLDLARKVAWLIDSGAYGLYHITNSGACTWYEFARTIFALAAMQVDLAPVTSQEYVTPAKRPPYSVLAHTRLAQLGQADMRPWHLALKAYLQEIGALQSTKA